MSDHGKEHSTGTHSSKQSKKQYGRELKTTLLDYFKNCKEEINDNTRRSIKVLPLSVEDLGITPVALELIDNNGTTRESLDEQTKREKITNAVQKLIEDVGAEKQLVVVKVDTPAVDLNKDFDQEQLQFMKNDIFKSIQNQLGAELPQDVETRWGTAFKAMMDIVEAEKNKQ